MSLPLRRLPLLPQHCSQGRGGASETLMSVLVCFGLSPEASDEPGSTFFLGRAFDLLLKEF